MTVYDSGIRADIPRTPTRSSGHLSSQPRRVEASSTASAAAAAHDLGDFEMSQLDAIVALTAADQLPPPPTDEQIAASKALGDLRSRKAGAPLNRDERRLEARYRAIVAPALPDYIELARSKGLLPSKESE